MVRIVLVITAVAALALPIAAQQADHQSASNPLVQLLQSKGILSAEEAASVRTASTSAEANERLARLLWSKGLISQEEYNTTVAAAAVSASSNGSTGAHMVNAAAPAAPAPAAIGAAPTEKPKGANWPVSDMMVGYDPSDGASADAQTIPAIAPIRVLAIGLPKNPKGIIPDIKLGAGPMINLYGFFKASAVYDSTNSGGSTFGNNDFPLPLLLGDTGPDRGEQFRIKARSARFGANFFYPINGPDITLTAKLEFDWEGDYTTVNNRNISSVRSSQASLRLAWMRMDTKWGTVPVYAEFGQDWTLLGSSTVMDLFETTGFGVGFGNFYERIPQFKVGAQFTAGKLKVVPEFAITLGAFGDSGLNNSVTQTLFGSLGQVATGEQNQTREGAILGPDSTQPGVQGRLVFDFPLNSNWKGVPNAEIIFSGGHAEAEEIVPSGNIPNTPIGLPGNAGGVNTTANSLITPNATCATFGGNPVSATNPASVRCYYPKGLSLQIPQNAFSAEVQLPTPWVTVVAKYYRGGDLRFMFAGQLNTAFADTSVGTALTIPAITVNCTQTQANPGCPAGGTIALASSQPVFSLAGDSITFRNSGVTPGTAVVAPLRPIRGQGGVFQLGFPLSRIFGADPEGRNSGWRLYVGYGVDSAFARDVIRSGGNGLLRSDYIPISLRYKINKWAEIADEVTWYDTRVADPLLVSPFTREVNVAGVPARVNHDIRQEFGTIFTF
ncbi:MAG TPA: hypothetical protein VLW54_08655 [Candidatus Acidoferrales bacterium]|nr:hypothetical protein [Candidatus Acidoferrales bacterium]